MEAKDTLDQLVAYTSARIKRTPGVRDVYTILGPIVRALVSDGPLPLEQVAAVTGIPIRKVKRILRVSPYAEWDADGRLTGLCLTLQPTPHRLNVGGRDLYVWTAVDALVSTVLLDQYVFIESSCRLTGTPIRLRISRTKLDNAEPSTAAVSVLSRPEQQERWSWLDASRQLFFRSSRAAKPWLDKNPDYLVLDVNDALEFARRLVESFEEETS